MKGRRFRRSVLVVVGALCVLTVACGGQEIVAGKAEARAGGVPAYLAVGDSVAFGLDPRLVPKPTFSCFSCDSFTSPIPPRNDNVFVGYPEYLRQILGVPLENASCPGETSVSFGTPAVTGQAAICDEFKEKGWLHAVYDGAQRTYALDFLESHPHVGLVTIALGANDLLDALPDVLACGSDQACISARVGPVLQEAGTRMSEILLEIRNTGYDGKIVVPLYYSPVPELAGLVWMLNHGALEPGAAPFGARFVDLQQAFGSNPCEAGLLIRLDARTCDIHPSEEGARLIAAMIAGVVSQ